MKRAILIAAVLTLAACGGPDANCQPVPAGVGAWAGPWFQYPPHAQCTYKGHLWQAETPGRAEPGTDAMWRDVGCVAP